MIDRFNPDTDRILAYTNQRVIELNNMVADNKPFQVDDILIANSIYCLFTEAEFCPTLYPSCISKGELMEGNKLIKAAKKATEDIVKYRTNLGMYKQATIDIDDDSYLIYYDPDHYATEKRLKVDVEKYQKAVIQHHNLSAETNVPKWCAQNRGQKFVSERGKAWSKYLAHRNYVFNLARPYATTVHKAQGSEFSKVFIDANDIAKAKPFSMDTYNRLMYVACSIAIEEVIFI